MCSFAETTHTPQGDGNFLFLLFIVRTIGNNPHPARGRKPVRSRSFLSMSETTHTPQGDGNDFPGRLCYHTCAETTHTPQGDGNYFSGCHLGFWRKQPTPRKGTETMSMRPIMERRRNNPHPARGRKLIPARPLAMSRGKQPTPRKGTETSLLAAAVSRAAKQPTPRKGTETQCFKSDFVFNMKQPTPRKGTETFLRRDTPVNSTKQPHPARGRKPRSKTQPVLLGETTHTPQGDGNTYGGRFVYTVERKQPTPRKGTETISSLSTPI